VHHAGADSNPVHRKKLGSLLEINRRMSLDSEPRKRETKPKPTISISRKFGFEACPIAERLQELMEKKTRELDTGI